jgi:hypothetical protein
VTEPTQDKTTEKTKDAAMGDGGGQRIKEGSDSSSHNLFKANESSKIKLLIICTRLTTLFDHAAVARSCRTSG